MGPVGGGAYCEYNTATATPWISMMKTMCMMSSLFTWNTAVQGATRKLPDHLNAAIPGGHRKCPPMGLATHMLDVEWKIRHNDWSKVGGAMLGQWSDNTVNETIELRKGGYCMPPGIYNEGSLYCVFVLLRT
eukprot:621456-Pyramimonas_sp.AAC.1